MILNYYKVFFLKLTIIKIFTILGNINNFKVLKNWELYYANIKNRQ